MPSRPVTAATVARATRPSPAASRATATTRTRRVRAALRSVSHAFGSGLTTASAAFAALTKPQKCLFDELKAFVRAHPKPSAEDKLVLTRPVFPPRDRKALQDMADDLQLDLVWDEEAVADQPIVIARFGALTLAGVSDDEEDGEDEILKERMAALGVTDATDAGAPPPKAREGDEALERVIKKWEKAKIVDDEDDQAAELHERKVTEQLEDWKLSYYKVRAGS
jgi:hypothetical protein